MDNKGRKKKIDGLILLIFAPLSVSNDARRRLGADSGDQNGNSW